jgi:hypothetical protein
MLLLFQKKSIFLLSSPFFSLSFYLSIQYSLQLQQNMDLLEKPKRVELRPDRYYTPQALNPAKQERIHAERE